MDIAIARQPIYDRNLKVFAYELLYRSTVGSMEYTAVDGDTATASVIAGTFFNRGVENITNGKIGFINFTENFLKSDIIKMLQPKYLGIEILETVEPTDDILHACDMLKVLGHNIILDDFDNTPKSQAFVKYADIIKMDFMVTDNEMLKTTVKKYKRKGMRFIAEKIETEEDFEKAKSYGYDYFQGYYFSKPISMQNRVLMPVQVNALKVIELMRNEDCRLSDIAKIISYDTGMIYNLLNLANSAAFSSARHKIKKVTPAIAKIGLREFRTWILFVLLYDMNVKKPNELIRQSTIRARVAERICVRKRLEGNKSDFALIGLLSLLDVIMDTPFNAINSILNMPEHIKNALADPGDDIYGSVIKMIRAYDQAQWDEAAKTGENIGMPLTEYVKIYLDSVKWCDDRYYGANISY